MDHGKMTEPYSKNITPDGLTGMLFALEGIRHIVVLLNGPMGCKFYHSTTSHFLEIRPSLYLPVRENGEKVPVDYNYMNDWFFRQARIPCTYLDGYDYVYGTAGKVTEALAYIRDHLEFELIAVVNSPGASLIGDNLKELSMLAIPDVPCIVLESPGFSTDFATGYSAAVCGLCRQLGPLMWQKASPMMQSGRRSELPCQPSVNILGLSIWQKYAEGDRLEIRRMFELCGIRINTFLCSDSTLAEFRNLPDADLNVVFYPEYGKECAEYLEEKLQMPCLIFDAPPVGFAASEDIMKKICRTLSSLPGKHSAEHEADPGPLLLDSEKARARAYYKINDIYEISGRPGGTLFAIDGLPSEVKAYRTFFEDYLHMICDAGEILNTEAELVFSDANTIAALKSQGRRFCGIEIANPGMGYVDVVPKTCLGIRGGLFLIEQVLNGIMNKL